MIPQGRVAIEIIFFLMRFNLYNGEENRKRSWGKMHIRMAKCHPIEYLLNTLFIYLDNLLHCGSWSLFFFNFFFNLFFYLLFILLPSGTWFDWLSKSVSTWLNFAILFLNKKYKGNNFRKWKPFRGHLGERIECWFNLWILICWI